MSETLLTAYKALLNTPTPPALGPGPRPKVKSVSSLETATDNLAREHGLPAREAALLNALVLLWHDHLEPAHAIVQGIADADGSLVHAMMHRREPDYWNSKYWWQKVGSHPAFTPLGARGRAILTAYDREDLAARLLAGGRWDPKAFVDFCQEATTSHDTALAALAIELQEAEFEEVLRHLAVR